MSDKPVNRQKVMCNFLSIPFLVVFVCSPRKVKKIVLGATKRVPFPARTHTYRHLLTQTKGMWPKKINRRVTPHRLYLKVQVTVVYQTLQRGQRDSERPVHMCGEMSSHAGPRSYSTCRCSNSEHRPFKTKVASRCPVQNLTTVQARCSWYR